MLAVWCTFFLYSAVAAPVPAVNEPHYLCKAKHYWQPDWCAPDFFLQSTNAHTVFYATIGSLTQWFTLAQTAWIGRVLAILVLALGWCSLLSLFSQCRWFPLHVGWLFLAFQACGNFSGEWLVGGVEGKVFSYGLLFGALGQIERGRTILAGALTGLAIAFHPVIGLWGLMACAGACFVGWVIRKKGEAASLVKPMNPSIGCRRVLLASLMLVLFALPGLMPVFSLLMESVPKQTKSAAAYIQVYYRLAHHLDPMVFLPRAYACYAALLVGWQIAAWLRRRQLSTVLTPSHSADNVARRFDRIVAFAVLFAIAGLIVGWGPRPAEKMAFYFERAQLLKFYPFRLADVLLPMVVSIGIARWIAVRGPVAVRVAGYLVLFAVTLLRANSNVEINKYSGELRTEWIDACRWIDQHLPADALVQSPPNSWAFKWFAGRAEYVAFKDCPQDSVGIVEWNRRLAFLKRWFEVHYDDNFYSADELRDLRAQTKITHILTDHLGPLDLEPVFRNQAFQVYDLTSLDR